MRKKCENQSPAAMATDLRKHLFLDHFLAAIRSKGLVLSGFVLGVAVSFFAISLLVSMNAPSAASSSSRASPFPWFFSASSIFHITRSNDSATSSFTANSTSGSSITENNATGLQNGVFVSGSGNVTCVTDNGNFSCPNLYPNSEISNLLHITRSNDSATVSFTEKSTSGSSITDNNATGLQNGIFISGSGNVTCVTKYLNGNFSCPNFYPNLEINNQSSTVNTSRSTPYETKENNISRDVSSTISAQTTMNDKVASLQNLSGSKNNESDVSVKAIGASVKKCDIYDGRWVRDLTKPHYPPGSCPYIDTDFNCFKNGRPDDEFLRWKWKPYGCDIPGLNATDFLERLRGKKILFVGDSLNRNMWESLVCILRNSIKDKSRVYAASGRRDFKIQGYYSFRFKDYMCSVDFVRSPFLVKEQLLKTANGSEDERLRLDLLDETRAVYRQADILVFNTGHWWTHDKTSSGIYYYQEGNHVYPVLEVMKAYKKALTTWAAWVDRNIDSSKTQVVFRGYSLTHFRGGQWNSGGQCHKEIEPIYNDTFITKYPGKMKALEGVLHKMETPVVYLNISRLTDYRKDGHPSIYRKKYSSPEEHVAAEKIQDCSHWCLPGVPDTWNELLYASLLLEGKGSWKK